MLAKKKLLSALAGLAMMSMPVSALAANHHFWNQNAPLHPQAVHAYQRAAAPRFAFNQAGHGGWGNRPLYAANQAGRYRFDNFAHNNGNWFRNSYAGWNSAPGFARAVPPPVYSYGAPYQQYAGAPWNRVNPQYAYNGNYGSGYGNGYGNGNGYENGYAGGNLSLRDRLLRDRAAAYRQLSVRERVGDHNGAQRLSNTINMLNARLARIS
ncbi:MAG: hypothetical protein ABSG46_00735 [Candidatus Binataceae bacterium]|jgi:hypothetical protein